MKKYEFKNYVTHRSAEVHVDVPGYEGIFLVQFMHLGEPDYVLKRTTEPGSGEMRFTSEEDAVRGATKYVTRMQVVE